MGGVEGESYFFILKSLLSGFPELSRRPPGWSAGSKFYSSESSLWAGMRSSTRNEDRIIDHKIYAEHPSGADFLTHHLTDARLDFASRIQDVVTCGDRLITEIDLQAVTTASQREIQVCFQQSPVSCMLCTSLKIKLLPD